MRAPIRAKFRVLDISQNYEGLWSVSMRPINRGRGKDPENAMFWKYTPSGEAELQFASPPEHLKVGDYYHMVFTPVDEGDFTLSSIEIHHGGYLNVSFSRSHSVPHPKWTENDRKLWMRDTLKMGINPGEVEGSVARYLELFGLPDDGAWKLEVSFAEESDD